MITYEFPARGEMPPLKLIWYDGNLRPPRPPELEEDREMGTNGHLLIGDKGKILSLRGQGRRGFELIPESRAKEYGDPPKKLPRSIGHHNEWIEACKGGQPGGSNFDWAGPLTEVVLLGNVLVIEHPAGVAGTPRAVHQTSHLVRLALPEATHAAMVAVLSP